MSEDHQFIVRLKSFINSADLLDSPAAQSVYGDFLEQNNDAAARLVECEVLLQKKKKIEAVELAHRDPDLFQLIDKLSLPECKTLLLLADLYDWQMPDEINRQSLDTLKAAAVELESENLRPLLMEFRRIAKTDQLKNKLSVLREISRIDKNNPEWLTPLKEVENRYLSQLITEAQQKIVEKDFPRLKEIFRELKTSPWKVEIPSIVLEKIDRILQDERAREAKEIAQQLLEKVNDAFAAFDVPHLDEAFALWKRHCAEYHYQPESHEATQIAEAEEYLKSEKKKQQAEADFKLLLETISSLLDASAPLKEIEKEYAKAQSFAQEIPERISRRFENYRRDVEKEHRAALVIRSIIVAGVVLITVLILVAAGLWTIDWMTEKRLAQTLHELIDAEKTDEARSFLESIEKEHPDLVDHPKIQRERAALAKLENDDRIRAEKFQALAAEMKTELAKKENPDPTLKTKLVTLESLARSVEEKEILTEIRTEADRLFQQHSQELEALFLEKIRELKQYHDMTYAYIKAHDVEKAEKSLRQLEKLSREISTLLPEISPEIQADHQEILNSRSTLNELLIAERSTLRGREEAQNALLTSENVIELQSALQNWQKSVGENLSPADSGAIDHAIQEIAYFKAILEAQNARGSYAVPAKYRDTAYFRDLSFWREYEQKSEAARKKILSDWDTRKSSFERMPLAFFRVQLSPRQDDWMDVYILPSGITSSLEHNQQKIIMKRSDGVDVTLSGRAKNLTMSIGSRQYRHCALLHPEYLSKKEIAGNKAVHQVLIEQLRSRLRRTGSGELLSVGVELLKEIRRSEFCAPYWKMVFSLQILREIAPLDLSADRPMVQLRDELLKLQQLDTLAGDPLANLEMAEKITEFFENYDFADLEHAIVENRCIQQLFGVREKCRFQFFGFAFKANQNLKYGVCTQWKTATTEVFCFDPEISGLVKVGTYSPDGLLLDEEFQDKAAWHLLFTTYPQNALTNTVKTLPEKINKKLILWPKFWPENMKGDLQ